MDGFAEFYAAHAAWVWLAVGAALLAVEVVAGSGWLLWPSASAGLVAVIVVFRPLPSLEALGLFAALVIVSTLTARRYFPRRLAGSGRDINDNIARLVGHEGRVVAPFEAGEGRVFVDGKEWAAVLEGAESLGAGARVKVAGVSGARLRVRGSDA
jgi:membrane protein implicated in regulation of membrane protease activity